MKKKENPPAARQKAPAGKASAPQKRAVRAGTADPGPQLAAQDASANGPKGLLRAGLKALETVHDDAVKHHAHVIESLLGLGKNGLSDGKAAATRSIPGLNFGLRKFEDVFDERVATAMQRLGLPSGREVQALRVQMRELLDRIELLEGRQARARARR